MTKVTRAAILGLDTAAGAYLARLLNARGYLLSRNVGPALLAELRVAGAVVGADAPRAGVAEIGAQEVYDLRENSVGGVGNPVAELIAVSGAARTFIAVAPRSPPCGRPSTGSSRARCGVTNRASIPGRPRSRASSPPPLATIPEQATLRA